MSTPESLKRKKVLILGASGFLGKSLVKALVEKDVEIRTYDRGASLDQFENANIASFKGDFVEGSHLDEALADTDVVYHLISTTIPGTSNLDLSADISSNLQASIRLLEKIKTHNIKKLIFISSGGAVYGNPLSLPVAETHPLYPISSYGIVKTTIEQYIYMFSKLYGLESTVLRLSNPYGPNQFKIGLQGFISTCFKKIINDEVLEIWGNGSVIRDYIYINDAIDAMLKALEDTGTNTYNIGSGVGHSLQEVINIISKIIGKKANVTYLPKRTVDVDKIYLDISKAKPGLNWTPKYSLEEGCKHYWTMSNTK